MELLNREQYEQQVASTREKRMAWWREARFGMFIHFGLYSAIGRHEWVMSMEGISKEEYETYADRFQPKEGCCKEWAKLAKAAGMKYMVLTTRHHEGFSLWDSKVNPFNSVNYGCHRDIVKEFVEACREEGLKIGFYSSIMDWRHPDGAACATDLEARRRFLDYIEALNTELLTNYGKIDILWYDVAQPMATPEEWDSVNRNQRLRALQPHIIINDRSRLAEDFGTPEGKIRVLDRDWEACMTFNDISWGYLDDQQILPYAYSAQRIIRMLNQCACNGGNLLLNVGPKPDGSIPKDAIRPLTEVGTWLRHNGEAVYGKLHPNVISGSWYRGGNGITAISYAEDLKACYLWNWICPPEGYMYFDGVYTKPTKVTKLYTNEIIPFTYEDHRIKLEGLSVNENEMVCVYKIEFEDELVYKPFHKYPQIWL
ncbi:MAG: alpha-L-fucosidase [Erysipelotrichaceae bacterium]|nr:alpha-L-fucosidase [Erysipelotrichaceae bacterium]